MRYVDYLPFEDPKKLQGCCRLTKSCHHQIPCLIDAIQSAGCKLEDQGCACSETRKIEPLCASCLFKNCDASDISRAAAAGSTLCSDYSMTHSGPPSAVASPTAIGAMEYMEDMEDVERAMTAIPATVPAQLVTLTQGGSTVTMEWSIMTMSGSVMTMLMPVPASSAHVAADGSSTVVEVSSTQSANAAVTPAAAMGAGAFAALGLAAAF